MNIIDAYFKKTIKYEYRGHNLNFQVSQALFSSQQLDYGTQRLLRTFTFEKIDNYNKVLDLGCGYGPIGIALKVFKLDSDIHMVDRDALALDYSRRNANLNNINNIKIYASLGYDDITDNDFDLIVSNVPAKVGEKVLSHILKDAQFYLKPRGHVVVVVIDPIVECVENILTTDSNINIIFRKAWSGHVVFHYNFNSNSKQIPNKLRKSAFDRGIFDREDKVFSIDKCAFPMKTTYGLSEFNTLNYATELLIKNLRCIQNKSIDSAIVFNPGQGHIPVALSLYAKTNKITLVGRDLQALRVSRRNLILNRYPSANISLLHAVDMSQVKQDLADIVIGNLDENDGPLIHKMLIEQAVSQLSVKGIIIVSSSSTAIARIEVFIRTKKYLEVLDRRRSKGKSSIILRRRNL